MNEMSRSGEIRWLAGVPGVGTMYRSPDTMVVTGSPRYWIRWYRLPFSLRCWTLVISSCSRSGGSGRGRSI